MGVRCIRAGTRFEKYLRQVVSQQIMGGHSVLPAHKRVKWSVPGRVVYRVRVITGLEQCADEAVCARGEWGIVIRRMIIDHPLPDVTEFGLLVKIHPRVVERYCRSGRIEAYGKPYRIHIKQAAPWGLTEQDCLRLLAQIRSPDGQ